MADEKKPGELSDTTPATEGLRAVGLASPEPTAKTTTVGSGTAEAPAAGSPTPDAALEALHAAFPDKHFGTVKEFIDSFSGLERTMTALRELGLSPDQAAAEIRAAREEREEHVEVEPAEPDEEEVRDALDRLATDPVGVIQEIAFKVATDVAAAAALGQKLWGDYLKTNPDAAEFEEAMSEQLQQLPASFLKHPDYFDRLYRMVNPKATTPEARAKLKEEADAEARARRGETVVESGRGGGAPRQTPAVTDAQTVTSILKHATPTPGPSPVGR